MPKPSETMKKLYLLILMTAAIALVNAAVFAYYPIEITITGVQPVVLSGGSNANQKDLGDNNYIVVQIGGNGASATVTLHPTYQYTYYHDVLQVKNNDNTKSYYIAFRVTQLISEWPDDSVAKMIVYSGNDKVAEVDLKSGDTTVYQEQLSAGGTYRIDFYFYYPEGVNLPSNTPVSVQLIYSPQNPASAPTVPP